LIVAPLVSICRCIFAIVSASAWVLYASASVARSDERPCERATCS
jgi:hypothetical protein